jgi:hypothetical protein
MVIAASRRNYAHARIEVEKIITDLHAPVEAPAKKPVLTNGDGTVTSTEKKPVSPTNGNGQATNGSSGNSNGYKKTNGNGGPSTKSPSVQPSKGKPVEQKSDRPKPRPELHKDQTAEGLRSILAKIAAVSQTDDQKPQTKEPSASAPATPPTTDRREALRSVLGTVLEAEPVTKVAPAAEASSTPASVSPSPATSPVYEPLPHEVDTAEPDIKTIKKILGNDARVKSPFS